MQPNVSRVDITQIQISFRAKHPHLALTHSTAYGWVCREHSTGKRAPFPVGLTTADLDEWANFKADVRQSLQDAPPPPPPPPTPPPPPPPPPTPSARGASAGAAIISGRQAGMQAAGDAYRAEMARSKDKVAARAAAHAAASHAGGEAGEEHGDASAGRRAAMGGVDEATSNAPQWWKSMMKNPYAESLIKPLTRFAGPAALGIAYTAARSSINIGQQGAQSIVQGAMSVVSGAFQAGSQIGQALLGGVLSPFGASGGAVGKLGGSVLGGVGGLLGGGGKLVGAVAGMGGAAVGGLAAGGLGLAGAGIGAFFGPPGVLVGLAIGTAIAAGVMKAVGGLAKMVGDALGAVGQAFGELGKLGVSAIEAITSVIKDTVQSALALSREVLDASQASGMGVGATAIAANNLSGFGIKNAPGMSEDVFYGGMMRSMLGVKGDYGSSDQIKQVSDRYQAMRDPKNGVTGRFMSDMYAESSGYGGVEQRRMLMLPDAIRDRQLERSESMQSSFGMSPDQISKTQQDFSMLTNSFSQFVELVKAKFASELLPFLTAVLDSAVKWVSENGKKIADGIKTVTMALVRFGEWLYKDFPVYVMGAAVKIVEYAAMIGQGLITMLGFFASFMRGLAQFLTFSAYATPFLMVIPMAIGLVVDVIVEAAKLLVTAFSLIANSLINICKVLFEAIRNPVATAKKLLDDPLYMAKEVRENLRASTKATWDFMPSTHFGLGVAQSTRLFSQGALKSADGLNGAADYIEKHKDSWSKNIEGARHNAQSHLKPVIAAMKERKEKMDKEGTWSDAIGSTMKEIAQNTKKTADATDKTANGIDGFAERVIGTAVHLDTMQIFQNALRG